MAVAGCRKRRQREAALLTNACRPAIAYSRGGTGRTPSAVPSSSNFPASHFRSEFGLIAQSYRAFSSPPLGRPTRLPRQAIFRRRRHQPSNPPLAKIKPGRPAPTMGPGTARNPRISPPGNAIPWMFKYVSPACSALDTRLDAAMIFPVNKFLFRLLLRAAAL